MNEVPASLKGMDDIVCPEIGLWQWLEKTARDILALYAFTEIRTPILERQEVFTRSLGETSDIVHKEMFAFEDRGGRAICLRPEGTAGVMRHLAGLGQARNQRLYYMGPMFRAENPQKGRKRQFHQLGVEALSSPSPWLDAEILELQHRLLAGWGVTDAVFRINSRGNSDDMNAIRVGLKAALNPHRDVLCADCKKRFEENILRVLDCKNPGCAEVVRSAPSMLDLLCPESRAYFDALCGALDHLGVRYVVEPRLVRGLDYYEHTIWEVTSPSLGSQDALSGGGRYGVTMGKQLLQGVGFGVGLERVILALGKSPEECRQLLPPLDLVLISMGERAMVANQSLAKSLRSRGISCVVDMSGKKMKDQFRNALEAGALRVLIRGDQELDAGVCRIKTLATQEQQDVVVEDVPAWLAR